MISFAIIGVGNIGRRHAEHILQDPAAQLVAICDEDPKCEALAQQWNVPFYKNSEDFFAKNIADVVNICTPNHWHKDHTIAALTQGSHALVEKPMALSTQECNEMIEAATRYGRKIFAVKQNRYNPPVQEARKLLQAGNLGELYMVQVNCFWNRNEQYYSSGNWRGKRKSDGGCLFTQFSHFIDILFYLVGDVEPVSGMLHNYLHQHNTEFEDTGAFLLRSTSGAMINFNFTTNAFAQNMEGSITLMGSKGIFKIGGQYLNTIEYSQIENIEIPPINIVAKENDYGSYKGSMSNHDKVIRNVIEVLQEQKPMMTSAEEGKKVIGIIEAMYASATTNTPSQILEKSSANNLAR